MIQAGISVVLFDLDGTLIDSQHETIASYQHALSTVGRNASAEDIRPWLGPPLADGLAALGVPVDQLAVVIERYRAHFSAVGLFGSQMFGGVADMLHALLSDGLTLGIATSKLSDFAEAIVGNLGIAGLFSVVAGATRDGTRMHKGEIVSSALECLGQPDPGTVVMVGDREHDIRAAVQLGLHSVGVLWGYGSRRELEAAGAEVLCEHPGQMRDLLGARPATALP